MVDNHSRRMCGVGKAGHANTRRAAFSKPTKLTRQNVASAIALRKAAKICLGPSPGC